MAIEGESVKTSAYIIILVFLATIANAITLTPGSVYETTTQWQTIDVDNYKTGNIITNVAVTSSQLTITNAENYTGWATTYTSNNAVWTNGTIETNVKSAVFEFQTQASTVSSDTPATITVNAGTTTVLNITILNDDTPPTITNLTPSTYARADATQTITITITDEQTSVATATYSYSDCVNNATNVVLTKNGNTFTGTADFTGYQEGDEACYTITATNAPGETATQTGRLVFDGTAPTVTIISPTNYATETTSFVFYASDNMASELTCTIKLDNTQLAQITAQNGTNNTVTANITDTEGSHTWSTTCLDQVGLTATHAQAITVDTQAPTITLTYDSAIPRTQDKTFTARATDTISIATVTAEFDGDNVVLTPSGNDYTGTISSDVLGNKTLTIVATDNAGHTTTMTKTIETIPNHLLTLTLNPTNAETGDTITASGTLTTDGAVISDTVTIETPSDNEVETLNNGQYTTTFTVDNSGTYTIKAKYTEDGHTYTTTAELTITGVESNANQILHYSRGLEQDTRGVPEAQIKQKEATNTEQIETEPVQTEQIETPAPAPYEPLPLTQEEPRQAYTPSATGIFSLGGAIKWISILLAIGLIAGLGAYAWSRRPKDNSGIDWDAYFKGR